MMALVAQPYGSGETSAEHVASPSEATGDLDAASLFRAHAHFVAAFLQRLGITQQESNDLVQEVFLLAHKKGGYRGGAARPTTWLAGLALGVARNHRRRAGRRTQIDRERGDVDPAPDGRVDPERVADARRSLDVVREALDRISEDQRVVLMLHELEGESSVSIAAGLSLPVGTVYARLHRGRKAFRAAYAELLEARGNQKESP